MSINEARQKIKTFMALIEKREVYGSILLIFVSISSFSLGRLSTVEQNKVPVTIENISSPYGSNLVQNKDKMVSSGKTSSINTNPAQVVDGSGTYVASKSGKKYFLPTCSGAKAIKEANKVWFSSKDDAIAAGYTAAINCEGI